MVARGGGHHLAVDLPPTNCDTERGRPGARDHRETKATMVEDDASAGKAASLFPQSVGERLRVARTAAGMDLQDVASKTRVPMRHLDAIERSEYAGLPSLTYAIGFARAYARAVGIDEKAIAHDLRGELDRTRAVPVHMSAPYEPADPARVPSRLLAYTALGVLVLVLAAYLVWRSAWWDSAVDVSTVAPVPELATAPASPAPIADGPVVLTATAPVWLRVYDRARVTLFEREMIAGETYAVPADADQPMILTGRPEALTVTIGGEPVAALGRAEASIRDLGISAAALQARAARAEPLIPTSTKTPPPTRRNPPTRRSAVAPDSAGTTPATEVLPDTNPVAVPPPSGNTGGI